MNNLEWAITTVLYRCAEVSLNACKTLVTIIYAVIFLIIVTSIISYADQYVVLLLLRKSKSFFML